MYKKTFLLFVALFCFTQLIVAQQDSIKTYKRSFTSFSLGLSRGIGKYGQSEALDKREGFALSGLNLQLERVIMGNRNAGLGFTIGRFTNDLDADRYKNQFVPEMFRSSKMSNVKPWRTLYALLGPYITISTSYVDIDFKCLGGVLFVKHPRFTLTYLDGSGQETERDISSTAQGSFGLNLGTNIRLKMSDKTQFKIGLDYITSVASVKYNDNSFKQNLNAFNVSWGVVFIVPGKE